MFFLSQAAGKRSMFQFGGSFWLVPPPGSTGPIREETFGQGTWGWPPCRRVLAVEPLARKTAARRPPPQFSESPLVNALFHSRSMGYVRSPSKPANEVSAWDPSSRAGSGRALFIFPHAAVEGFYVHLASALWRGFSIYWVSFPSEQWTANSNSATQATIFRRWGMTLLQLGPMTDSS